MHLGTTLPHLFTHAHTYFCILGWVEGKLQSGAFTGYNSATLVCACAYVLLHLGVHHLVEDVGRLVLPVLVVWRPRDVHPV